MRNKKGAKKIRTVNIHPSPKDLARDADLIELVVHGPPSGGLWGNRLELLAVRGLVLEAILGWTEKERARATDYAFRVHLSASDNDDVKTGKEPACLAKLQKEVTEVFAIWKLPIPSRATPT